MIDVFSVFLLLVIGESAVEVEVPKDRRAKPAPKAPKQNPVKRCRLVVRNLNFKVRITSHLSCSLVVH